MKQYFYKFYYSFKFVENEFKNRNVKLKALQNVVKFLCICCVQVCVREYIITNYKIRLIIKDKL